MYEVGYSRPAKKSVVSNKKLDAGFLLPFAAIDPLVYLEGSVGIYST